MNAKQRVKKVVSASRRTELLAHYPEYLARRLRDVGPGNVHTAVIWTKDPTNLLAHADLRQALSQVGQVFVHWTITGLGGTFLEPNVPAPEDQLHLLPRVVEYVGDPNRIHWRFDPLVSASRDGRRVSNIDLDLFRSLAEAMASAGVAVVRTSFVTIYRKVAQRLAKTGIEFEDYASERRRSSLTQLASTADEMGLKLLTCCEPGFPVQHCIDGELLSALHPRGEPCPTDRARGQRKLCGCTASLDIGRYLRCPNGCLYCYAHPAS
jgi:DNA repair photolyase